MKTNKVEIDIGPYTITDIAKTLNNAYVAFWDILSAVNLGTHLPAKWDKFAELPYEELLKRRCILADLVRTFERLEEEENERNSEKSE